eukprot:g10704.t1
MYNSVSAPPPPQSSGDGNNPNPNSSSAGDGDPSSLSPPVAPSGEAAEAAAAAAAAAATATGYGASSASSGQPQPAQQEGGSSVYDLFLTAVGLTPRGLAADTFSTGGSAGQAEEEDFWSAHEEDGEDSRAAGAAAATRLEPGGVGDRYHLTRQFRATTNGEILNRTSGATRAAGASAPSTLTGAHSRPGERPTSRTRQQLLSQADMGRYPGGEPDGQAGSSSLESAAAVAGTARRRRRMFGSNTPAAAESESRTPGSRPAAASRGLNSRGNPLFRSVDRGSLWRPNAIAGNATFDDEEDDDNDDEEGHAAGAGMRAVERVVNGASSVPTGAVANGRSASRRSGSSSLDASERGEGGGGGGSSTSGEGRILFYHKPTLAHVPAGDVPDVVPVYLGCPRGNMALGLPLNEAWQGEEHQDTTFNQNLSYTILSWPEDHVQDLLELWRLQVLFFATIIFNILLSALLIFTDNPDRSRVEGFARAGAFPGPFQQRAYADDPTGLRSEEWHLTAAFLLSVLGMVCVMARLRAGIALYLVLTVVNAVVGLGQSPGPLFACRYAVDVILVAMGRTFLSSLTYTWVTASAGDGRRG